MEDKFLGKKTVYYDKYNPKLLLAIPRQEKREEINLPHHFTESKFWGADIWNVYEASWLGTKGKPEVAIFEIHIPATSECIIESKSMKLYFNSLNNEVFQNTQDVIKLIQKDFSELLKCEIQVIHHSLDELEGQKLSAFQGIFLDDLDVEIDNYQTPQGEILTNASNEIVTEKLCSNLLKSNCLVTNQPDWASVQIHYEGKQIDREKLLQYLISFRNHNEFHEQCVERIFTDIMQNCQPKKLSVYARYTRRGGIDINPFRSNFESASNFTNKRQIRQ